MLLSSNQKQNWEYFLLCKTSWCQKTCLNQVSNMCHKSLWAVFSFRRKIFWGLHWQNTYIYSYELCKFVGWYEKWNYSSKRNLSCPNYYNLGLYMNRNNLISESRYNFGQAQTTIYPRPLTVFDDSMSDRMYTHI